MMTGAAVQNLEVDVGACTAREAFEEVGEQLGVEVADLADFEAWSDNRVRAAAQASSANSRA